MGERLYYTDALLREFDARVVSCEPAGARFLVTLDRTAFYPASGGQPFDTGRLDAARVAEVIETEEGDVRHLVEASFQPGATVRGAIDWPRRFDHMQQHTGQHLLSAAFDRLHGARTTGFHMSGATSTIDLARDVTPGEIDDAVREANRVVWEDRPVSVRFVSADEAAALPLRKAPVRAGRLRLVEVAGFDLSACGGTHVPATGMVGVIAVSGWERFKGATRLTFVCGGRALAAFGALRDVVTGATRRLSVLPAELPAAIERLQAGWKEAGRALERLEEELAGYRAAGLRDAAETIGPYRVVLRPYSGDAAALKRLAAAIVSVPGCVVVFTGDGRPTPVVVARSVDVAIDAGAWMKRAAGSLGGRGGGRPEAAQGGLDAAPDDILAFARRTLL